MRPASPTRMPPSSPRRSGTVLNRIRRHLTGAVVALEFLTPLRFRRVPRYDDHTFAESLGWYPLAGLLIGIVLLLVDEGLGRLLPRAPVAAIEVALLALLSGGLHLDGVADTADGMAYQGDRAGRLGVMSEGNTGPAGVMALVIVLLATWAALASLESPVRAGGLVLAPALARWTVVPVALLFRPARPRGLGRLMHEAAWPVAAPLATAIALVAAVVLFAGAGVLLIVVGGIAAVLIAGAAARMLDGVTGDVFGASIEVSQVVIWYALIAAAARGAIEPFLFG
ncbi:MAG: adenosylcobinamide-GDP ribazoletransferase [Chloroflexi bacterium]|nr:adenosylcobinamide-GDP ribazoletransferase [Chloroflexota bacterium]